MATILTDPEAEDLVWTKYGLRATLLKRFALEASDADGYVLEAGADQYFLKPFPNYLPVETSVHAASLHALATELGAPLAPLFCTRDGAPALVTERFSGTLQKWIAGRPAQRGNSQDAAAALDALAQFAVAMKAVPLVRPSPEPFACLPDTPAALADLGARWRAGRRANGAPG